MVGCLGGSTSSWAEGSSATRRTRRRTEGALAQWMHATPNRAGRLCKSHEIDGGAGRRWCAPACRHRAVGRASSSARFGMIAVAVIAPHCLEAAPKEEDTYALFRFRPAISKIMSDHIKSVGLALTRDLSASRAALPPLRQALLCSQQRGIGACDAPNSDDRRPFLKPDPLASRSAWTSLRIRTGRMSRGVQGARRALERRPMGLRSVRKAWGFS
jgi:hypothetical protein